MSSPLHAQQVVADGIHTPVAFTYLTSASLASSTGFNQYDAYKMAFVTGDNSLWLLINPLSSPPQWINIPATLATGSITAVQGTGGSSVTTSVNGVATVSSSAPPWNNIFGTGGTTVSVTGNTIQVSSSLGQSSSYVGSGGTSVTVVGSTVTVSSSAPPWNDIFGQGATSVVVTGGQIAISSSFSPVTQILGVGSVTVTHVGGVWTVSGSGGSGGTPITSISGSGGITTTNVDVNGNVVVSGTIAAFASSSYVVMAIDAENPNERKLTAVGGISLADGGAGGNATLSSSLVTVAGSGGTSVKTGGGTTYTVSSSIGAPPEADYIVWGTTSEGELANALLLLSGVGLFNSQSSTGITQGLSLTGLGGTTIGTGSHGDLTISSSLGQSSSFYGAGATTVTVVGASVTVSSSAPPWNDIFGQGGTSVTVTGGQIAVSSSLVTVAGSGGTTVTTGGGTTYTVSSSAPPFDVLLGKGGTTVSQVGDQATVSSSIGANLQASYVQVAIDAENPNARKLTAGSGISLTDGGAGGNLTVAATAGVSIAISSSFMAASLTVPALLSGSQFIMMKTSNQQMTATLPSPATYPNSLIIFKDIQGFASGGSLSTVLISPTSTQTTIDALSSSYLFQSPWGSKGFISPDGISWFTVF